MITEFYEVSIAPVQHLWASLAEIGILRVLSYLPHHTDQMQPNPRRLLADGTGAKPGFLERVAETAHVELRRHTLRVLGPMANACLVALCER